MKLSIWAGVLRLAHYSFCVFVPKGGKGHQEHQPHNFDPKKINYKILLKITKYGSFPQNDLLICIPVHLNICICFNILSRYLYIK